MPVAVNRFSAAGTLECPPRLNVSKKQKKPRNPPASPFSSPPTSPFTTQYWICHRGGHPRRICAIARDLARCCAAETPVEPAAAESTCVGAGSAVPELAAAGARRHRPAPNGTTNNVAISPDLETEAKQRVRSATTPQISARDARPPTQQQESCGQGLTGAGSKASCTRVCCIPRAQIHALPARFKP